VRATVPANEFTLIWQHSVEKIRWEERYQRDGGNLVLVEARIQGSGAGMEAPADAVLKNGWWSWQPRRVMTELTLTQSSFVEDYSLCWRDRCRHLRELVGNTDEGAAIVVETCAMTHGSSSRSPIP
jgi:hypothetical protein